MPVLIDQGGFVLWIDGAGRQIVAVLVAAMLMFASFGGVAGATEDPAIQEDMALSVAGKLGISPEDARQRLDNQDALAPVSVQIQEAMGELYAGIWFEGKRMKVGIPIVDGEPDPSMVHVAEEILATSDKAEFVDLVPVTATDEELRATQARLEAALDDDIKVGMGIKYSDNAVVLDVDTANSQEDRARIDEVVQDVGGNIEVRSEDGVLAEQGAGCNPASSSTYLSCDNPLRGGVFIREQEATPETCSAGFVVLGNSGGRPFLLTAGHCLSARSNVYWEARNRALSFRFIGAEHNYTLSSTGDYGIIRLEGEWLESSYVVYDGVSTWNPEYHITDAQFSREGMDVCGTGYNIVSSHYTDCGQVTELNYTVRYSGGGELRGTARTNLCIGVGGNSGGPFYKNGHAYGIFAAYHTGSTCEVFYQGINAALSALNVHLPG